VTATHLKEWWHRSPFAAFDIIVPGREAVHVPHPDFLTVSPSGRIAEVWLDDDRQVRLDVLLITAVEESGRNGKSRRRSRRKPRS
jgi:hypothetical protein